MDLFSVLYVQKWSNKCFDKGRFMLNDGVRIAEGASGEGPAAQKTTPLKRAYTYVPQISDLRSQISDLDLRLKT